MSEAALTPSSNRDVVGPYAIRGLLGQGGMGTVYRAFDPRLERTVALKVIAPSASGDGADPGELSARLFREARAVASLSHPNVVAVYDVGESNGLLYLAMEYVVGTTLRAVVGEESVPRGRRIRWLVDVARALDAAHRAGIVHRDVKPENVMIREDGVVKVLDFGIARRTVAPEPGSGVESGPHVPVTGGDAVTQGGAISGTPLYMAPEQLRGDVVDARADQFAWGVMAFEVLAGRRPWTPRPGEGAGAMLRMLSEAPAPLRSERPDVPHVVDETVARTLAKNPAARFSSMADVADALEPFASHGAGERVRVPAPETNEAFAETARVPADVSLTPGPTHPSGPAPRVARARQLVLPLALLAALVSGTALYVQRHPPTRAVAETARPRPLSLVPEADKAFREAMSLFRDGSSARALASLRRAVELDPSFAAAHLEIALQTAVDDPPGAQAAFQRAFEDRHMLTVRDVALLDASEPFVRALPDLEEWETRLTAAVFQHPRDPELQLHLGHARERLGDDDGAKLAYEAALKLDAGYVPALAALANVQRSLGDARGALATTERCMNASPVATACVERRLETFTADGPCARARDEASLWASLDPTSARAASALARALNGAGAPRQSVEEALARSWALEPEPTRRARELWDRASLAVQGGDLLGAVELAAQYEAALPPTANRVDHARSARLRMELLFELDHAESADDVASDFLHRNDAWMPYPFAPDPRIPFVETLRFRGQLARSVIGLGGDESSSRPATSAWTRWSLTWDDYVQARPEALAALAAAPRTPLGYGERRPLELSFALGKAQVLAGAASSAQTHLARVTGTCATLDAVVLVVRGRYYEGLAFEALGARDKARASYEAVLATWPLASGARTSRLAATRLDALR